MRNLKSRYEKGELTQKEYADAMMQYHSMLMNYTDLVKQSDMLKELHVSKEHVYLEIVDEMTAPQSVNMAISSGNDSRCFSVWILNFGAVEKKELHMFRKITDILKPKSFFDIGANEGWYSFHMMKRFPNISCYSFEPIPETCKRAKINLELNGQSTKGLMNVGLSDENKTAIFYFNNQETGATSMRNIREKEDIEKLQCTLRKLDDIVAEQNITSMDLLKCDVEGAEIFALKGGIESIKKYKPVIFCEMLRKWCAKFDYHPNDIIEMLSEIGYSCYRICDDMLEEIDKVTESTVETNFFFLDKKKHDKILSELEK